MYVPTLCPELLLGHVLFVFLTQVHIFGQSNVLGYIVKTAAACVHGESWCNILTGGKDAPIVGSDFSESSEIDLAPLDSDM